MQISDTEPDLKPLDASQLIQRLHDLDLEEGRRLITQCATDLADQAAFGVALADKALKELYTPFLSLKLAELLIFFGNSIQHPLSHALGLKAKGDALVQIGHFQAAIKCLDDAGAEFLRLGDEGNWARSRISWIMASESLGHVEEALEDAERARSTLERLGEPYWACTIAINTAIILDHLGRYQDAIKLYEHVRSVYPTLTDQHEVDIKRIIAIVESNQAISFSWLGRFSEAITLQQKAYNSFLALGDIGLVVFTEIDMANLAYTQGYYGQALLRYLHVRDTLMQDDSDTSTNPMLLADLKLWMADCLTKLNRTPEACQLVEEAVATYKQIGTSLQTSNALREYGNALQASGRFQEALTVLKEALTLFHHGGFDLYISATKLQEAEILLEMGDLDQAHELAQQIREQFEAQHFVARSIRASLIIIQALFRRASQAEVLQDSRRRALLLEEATYLARQIALQAKKYNLQEERYKSHFYLGQVFALQGNAIKAAKHYRAAIIQIERILDNLAFDLSPSFLHAAWRVYEEMIALCIRQSQPERAFSYLERVRSVALRQYLNSANILEEEEGEETTDVSLLQGNRATRLHIQYELREWQEKYHYYSALLANMEPSASLPVDQGIIQAEIQRCESRVNELFERLQLSQSEIPFVAHIQKQRALTTEQDTIKRLQQRLAPNQLLLTYFLFKDTLTIFAVTSEHLRTFEIPEGRKELERLLPFLHIYLHPSSWPDVQKPPQQAIRRMLRKLYALLIDPIKALLPPEQGQLTIVPYGPLHTLPFHALYDGSRFLIEDFQINYLPASNLLLHFSNYGEKIHNAVHISPGTRMPLVFGYSGNGHVQHCIAEAETLASMLRGRCFLEKDATIAHLIEQAPGSTIIHIATHGRARLDAPNFSSVLLADGQLNAIDAFSLDLHGCELVTLSGCETGLALSGGGDEQLGLGRAFLASGARALVISLWPVEDRSTNELMQVFYQRLLSGENKMQALRAAQCSLLHSDAPTLSHPYFWAAFRLIGDPAPLSTCTKSTP